MSASELTSHLEGMADSLDEIATFEDVHRLLLEALAMSQATDEHVAGLEARLMVEVDRVPPVVEVIEGEGPNVRIRTVVDPEQWAVPDGVNRRPGALPFNQSLLGGVEP